MSHPGAVDTPHAAHHEAHHEEDLGFLWKYVFSVDHKVIGIQYAVTGLLFLLFGFSLMMLMRWQLAYPGIPLPLLLAHRGTVIGCDEHDPMAECDERLGERADRRRHAVDPREVHVRHHQDVHARHGMAGM